MLPSLNMQDLEAERVAEEAAAQQRVEAAQAKKRKTPSGTVHLAPKKRKTPSVQQLHTAEPAPDPAKTQQQSKPVNQTPGKQSKAGGTPVQADAQREPQNGAEDEAEGLNSRGLASGSNHPSTQHANRSKLQLQTGTDAAASSAAPAKSELHLDASAQQSHEAGPSGSKVAGKLTSVKECYVKWKGKSYLHCSWVRHDDVLKVARHSAGLNQRFRNYQRSVYGMPQVSHRSLLCHLLPVWDHRHSFPFMLGQTFLSFYARVDIPFLLCSGKQATTLMFAWCSCS